MLCYVNLIEKIPTLKSHPLLALSKEEARPEPGLTLRVAPLLTGGFLISVPQKVSGDSGLVFFRFFFFSDWPTGEIKMHMTLG